MEITLAQKAISLALNGEWEEAIKVNLEILSKSPSDIEALNRLGRAYTETGKISEAKEIYKKVLEIDPLNSIALKCLERWRSIKKTDKASSSVIDVDAFLEESGKTKIVNLFNLGDGQNFANLDPGEEVQLATFAHKVSVVTKEGRYIGRLSDDLALRIKNLIKNGNKYKVLIKSIEPKEVTIFIRETEKGAGSDGTLSFPPEKIEYVAFTPPELVHKDQPLEIGEDLEEAEGI